MPSKIGGEVLVVEDQLPFAEAVRDYVRKVLSLPSSIFQRGGECARYVRTHKDKVLAILLDLTLLDGSASQLVPIIKRYNSNIKIIVVTGDDSDKRKLTLFAQGIDDYVVKPVAIPVLGAIIKRRLQDKSRKKLTLRDKRDHKIFARWIFNKYGTSLCDTKLKRAVFLTSREAMILRLLIKSDMYTFTRTAAVNELPGLRKLSTLSAWVHRLNQKLGAISNGRLLVKANYGTGYRLVKLQYKLPKKKIRNNLIEKCYSC